MTTRTLIPVKMVQADARVVTRIYRPFFLAGLLSVLTAGCLLGAIALLGIARAASYTASAWTPYVLAHANSQLYGWVGFFIIGFSLQQHAPRLSRLHVFHRMAAWTLGLMAVGIGLRFAAEPMVAIDPGLWIPVGIFSCSLQTVAVALFGLTIAVTRYKTGSPLTWQSAFVFGSLAWWMLVAIAEPFFFARSHAPDGILFVAEWFSPYREAQFLGFVSMMIFGVALTKLSSCFGAAPANATLGKLGFLAWNAGLIVRMAGWLTYFRSGMMSPSTWHVGGLLLACGAIILVVATRIFEPLTEFNRSQKFIRAAFGWLIIAGCLLVLEPAHLSQIGSQFSHPYTGAIRHAITVGFISQMIVGVSLHVVGRMNDLDVLRQNALWSVFWLLNVGNALRVILEIGTDYSNRAFLPMGFTGFVELTALVIWAASIAVPMLKRVRMGHSGVYVA